MKKSKSENIGDNSHYRYFNRDISLLEFNYRVFGQALNKTVPLLERLKFLIIFSSNIDEFFMKRVGYLKRVKSMGIMQTGNDNSSPKNTLNLIYKKVRMMMDNRYLCFKEIKKELEQNNVILVDWSNLSMKEKDFASNYFREKVFPILTPLAVDAEHPFPFISNLSLSLGIQLKRHKKDDHDIFARIKIPKNLPQWLRLPEGNNEESTRYRFVSLINIIEENLYELFPESKVKQVIAFRVTRSVEIPFISDDIEDRVDMVEEELRKRRLADIVRLEYKGPNDLEIFNTLKEEMELEDNDIYILKGIIDFSSLEQIASLNIPNLRYKPWSSVPVKAISESDNIFKAIAEKDILVHHPYESFSSSVEKFIRDSVYDKNVISIKITLYRAGYNSPIIPLLIGAAEKGKQVVCVIELKARFDEKRNIYWGETLEKAGVHVVYGISKKKTHAKAILVVRQEGEYYKLYCHFGTGNYNASTSKVYTDLGLFTCNRDLAMELVYVFNSLTGLSLKKKKNYKNLLVAPINLRKRILKLIENEVRLASQGEKAHIIAKMNSLQDKEVCDALYNASCAGVKVELIIRGFSSLRPEIVNLSENIRVVSIIGRFLEHSRIYYFRNASEDAIGGKFFMGSADLMKRNLDNRVEIILPILDKNIRKSFWNILQSLLNDKAQSWKLNSDGSYDKPKINSDSKAVQEIFMEQAGKRIKHKKNKK